MSETPELWATGEIKTACEGGSGREREVIAGQGL